MAERVPHLTLFPQTRTKSGRNTNTVSPFTALSIPAFPDAVLRLVSMCTPWRHDLGRWVARRFSGKRTHLTEAGVARVCQAVLRSPYVSVNSRTPCSVARGARALGGSPGRAGAHSLWPPAHRTAVAAQDLRPSPGHGGTSGTLCTVQCLVGAQGRRRSVPPTGLLAAGASWHCH